MSDTPILSQSEYLGANPVLTWVSRYLAILGGLIMMALAIMVVASILGRLFFQTSVTGDYELVEMGLGISIFCFLPYCHLKKGHVVVDIFTASASPRTLLWLAILSDCLMCFVAAVLTWRLALGGLDAYDYFDYTMILQLPNWIVYAVGCGSFGLLTLNCLDSLLTSLKGLKHG
ncbi:Tripartite ATP-independent periplasmic transporters, DctQ component [Marinomonas spartinae]|uniref:TRAP transporter small permease protein n=1 Tax=Marinomonas spartinae TaxID=1792290 RepID=A0A1A8TMR3_9GAMM|nr:TRAP transporter small permease [Marinomonas spartinae]SBS35332.1 Tripartite ATP-independent periplasmic transporters, DctQ component [Marinomonas spartinae]SBS39412.1 Tripartite ATP-independent periplasmic transporters, DctQ component [Marinomonas spartinae]